MVEIKFLYGIILQTKGCHKFVGTKIRKKKTVILLDQKYKSTHLPVNDLNLEHYFYQ